MLIQLAKRLFGEGASLVAPSHIRELIAARRFDEARRLLPRLHSQGQHAEVERLCLQAELAFHANDDAQAESLYRQALNKAPGCAEAHYGLSLIMAEAGEMESALEHALFARTAAPGEPRFLAQLGYCYLRLEMYPAAEAPLRQAIKLRPTDKNAWNNLGVVMRQRPHVAEAKACFLQALELDPGNMLAQENLQQLDAEIRSAGWESTVTARHTPAQSQFSPELGLDNTWEAVAQRLAADQADEAIGLAEDLVADSPEMPGGFVALALTYKRAAEHDAAAEVLRRCVDLFPDYLPGRLELGKLLFAVLEQPRAALEHLEEARGLDPDRAETRALLGACYHRLERYREAVGELEQAITFDESPLYRLQLGSTLLMACRYPETIALYEDLLARDQVARHDVVGNYASALGYAGRLDEALGLLDEALEQHAFDPALRMMRAMIHLLHERYDQGWDDYQWRYFSHSNNYRVLPFPKWRGEPLDGKSIVVLAEQGLGDQVMFASCIPDLVALKPRRVVVEVVNRVARTLERSLAGCEVIPTSQRRDMAWAAHLEADCYVPLGDLPKYFRRDRAHFPGRAFLAPDPTRQAFWRERLAERGPRPWIGISWKGGTEVTRSVVRTAQVTDFADLAHGLSATWVSLQYGPVDEALQQAEQVGFPLHHWDEAIKDLDEFAALVSVLDLVVTVCNTTVHYAGGLGRPTLVLAPQIPEWRYGLAFDRMPWYPDVTVLRQEGPGDWSGLFTRARRAVKERLR